MSEINPVFPMFSAHPSDVINEKAFSETQIALLAEAGGGVTRHILDLHRGLVKRGWNATLILSPKRFDDRYLDEIAALDKNSVVLVDMERSPNISDFSALHQIRSVLKAMKGVRVLHAHSTKAGMLGALLYHDVDALTYTPHAYRATDPALNVLTRRALRSIEMTYSRPYDRIIAVSESERDYALKCGVAPDRVTCIPNGIEYDQDAARALREHRKIPPAKPVLGFVGRLTHQKNPILFIETLACMVKLGYEASAVVIGEGELLSDMVSKAQMMKVAERITWKGAIPAKEALGEMDIIVHTSLYEALPYTLLEACAASLPIVATDNHGSRSVMQGRLGENIVDSTGEALSHRIALLLKNIDLWQQQLELLDEAATIFSTDQMVRGVERVYRNAVTERLETSQVLKDFRLSSVSRIQPLF